MSVALAYLQPQKGVLLTERRTFEAVTEVYCYLALAFHVRCPKFDPLDRAHFLPPPFPLPVCGKATILTLLVHGKVNMDVDLDI